MAVSVEIVQEEATSKKPAQVIVRENGQVVATVEAKIELKPGADSGQYHCVTLVVKP